MANNVDAQDVGTKRGLTARSTDLFMSSYDGFLKKHVYEVKSHNAEKSEEHLHADETGTPDPKDKKSADTSSNSASKSALVSAQDKSKMPENLQPRALYTEWSQAGPQHLPRWPMEMQVIPEKITHSCFPDQPRLPYVRPVLVPETLSSKSGRVVYLYKVSISSSSFQRSCVGGAQPDSQSFTCHELTSPEDTTLIFESRFESGNLEKAVQISKNCYNLYLRHDLFNQQQTQWFYFRIGNVRQGITYRFFIVNLSKPHSLYRCGVRPLAYSAKMAAEDQIGWHRVGHDISYFRNLHSICIQNENVPLYTLSFSCEFPYSGDEIFLANCFPYTYTQLQEYLLSVQQDACRSSLCRQRVLCWSLAGNLVPLLTISTPESTVHKFSAFGKICKFGNLSHPSASVNNSEGDVPGCQPLVRSYHFASSQLQGALPLQLLTIAQQEKIISSFSVDYLSQQVVVLTARVHPGESNSSWIMKGLLDYLTSQHPRAKTLRQLYIFKIVPMLNPDGVIVGNSRCSLTGRDLNRQYRSLLKDTFPSVWYTRQLVQRLNETNQVFLYCDMHGHSRQSNVFLYGCENTPSSPSYLQEWILPLLMHKWAPDKFSLECCATKVQKARVGTARVTMWKMGVLNSYTLEASMGGCTLGQDTGYHFTIEDYEATGRNFCDALYEYSMATPTKLAELHFSVRELIREEVIKIDSDLVASDGEQDATSNPEDLSAKMANVRVKSAASKKRLKKPTTKQSGAINLKNTSPKR